MPAASLRVPGNRARAKSQGQRVLLGSHRDSADFFRSDPDRVREVASGCRKATGGDVISIERNFEEIELKSLILAQIERWRHALHMQVERAVGATRQSVANG